MVATLRKSQGHDYFFCDELETWKIRQRNALDVEHSGKSWQRNEFTTERIRVGMRNSRARDCTGIGVATMFEDRFAAITNTNASFPGQLTTKPVSFRAFVR